MRDDLNIPSAVVVLDLEADLIEAGRAINKRGSADHADLWDREAKRLWSKIFMMAAGEQWRDRAPMPPELSHELREAAPRQAAIRAVARALATVSGRPETLETEAARLADNVDRFLETPAGLEHKAHIDKGLRIREP